MTNKLDSPIIFNDNRDAPDFVQTKCPKCGAWWQTNKQAEEFTERFECDCGHPIAVKVPKSEIAKPLILKPSTADILAMNPTDGKFDTGMKVEEAIHRAQHWWQTKGAKEMQLHKKRQKKSTASNTPGLGGAFASLDPDNKNFLPSGIIHGKPWDDLRKPEKVQIVKVWHHIFVRMPDKLDEQDTGVFKNPDRHKLH